jgi:hypothetical protein
MTPEEFFASLPKSTQAEIAETFKENGRHPFDLLVNYEHCTCAKPFQSILAAWHATQPPCSYQFTPDPPCECKKKEPLPPHSQDYAQEWSRAECERFMSQR